jgi:hypothetical protein
MTAGPAHFRPIADALARVESEMNKELRPNGI